MNLTSNLVGVFGGGQRDGSFGDVHETEKPYPGLVNSQATRATGSNPAHSKPAEPIHIISLGAGVQSTVVALMAMMGLILPMPVAGIFADTKHESLEVYLWLKWLCGCEIKQREDGGWEAVPGVYQSGILPFPIHVVSKGDLKAMALRVRQKKDGSGEWVKTCIPAFILNKDGSRGMIQRQCTYDYKVLQIIKAAKLIMKQHSADSCVQWIGISLDEIYRMKESLESSIRHRWPLVEAGMKRHDCVRWMSSNGFPKPPRSACIFCPYHSDAEWQRLKTESPSEFESAVKFDANYRAVKARCRNMAGLPFLHSSLKPLSEVDFSTEEERGQLNMFNNECEGMCGV